MRLLILDDQVTPYRISMYTHLAKLAGEFKVLYCAPRLRERSWKIPHSLPFDNEVLPHVAIRLRRPPYGDPRTILINPSLLLRLLASSPDVVVGYSFSVPAITAFLYAKIAKRAFISWSTDTLHTERYLNPRQRFIRRVIISRADACVAPSSEGREKFLAYGANPSRTVVAVQSADVEYFRRACERDRSSLSTSEDNQKPSEKTILYVGFLSERKGVTLLLEAFRLVSQRMPDAELLLVGEGPKTGDFRELAQKWGILDRIHFLGFIDQIELPRIYSSAKVFAFPTLEDTFGVVLSEAAACGLPLVSSIFAGATSEFVKDGINGYRIDPRETEDFANALIKILANNQLQTEMGSESLQIAVMNDPKSGADSFWQAVQLAFWHKKG